jgi:hypothetical protein
MAAARRPARQASEYLSFGYSGFHNFVAALERSDNAVARNHAFARAQARLR